MIGTRKHSNRADNEKEVSPLLGVSGDGARDLMRTFGVSGIVIR
jgi:hypothetical protein